MIRAAGDDRLCEPCFGRDDRGFLRAEFGHDYRIGRNNQRLRKVLFQVSWSADSRLLLRGSADSILKVWDGQTRKMFKIWTLSNPEKWAGV